MRRKILALVAIAVSCGLLAACDAVDDSQQLSTKYACDSDLVVSGNPVTWEGLVTAMRPTSLPRQGTQVFLSWAQLMRDRNHFGGADNVSVPVGATVVIPRSCAKGEKAPTTGPTFTAPEATTPPSS